LGWRPRCCGAIIATVSEPKKIINKINYLSNFGAAGQRRRATIQAIVPQGRDTVTGA
jgi:hypothetical protein